MRFAVVAATLLLGAATAGAQPVDPYAAPSVAVDADVEIDEAVAVALVDRARVLEAAGAYADAKQLVVEAMRRRPSGPIHDAAKALLDELNQRLGIGDRPVPVIEPIAPPNAPPGELLMPPVDDPAAASSARTSSARTSSARTSSARASRLRLIGSGVVWGGLAGGMFADVVSGLEETTAGDVAVGVGLGAAGGALVASLLRTSELTVGDAALIDSVTGWGTTAAVAFAFAIAPAETEAYTLNGTLGAAGGSVIGHVVARGREVSAGRLAKVNAIAAVGAAAPWLLYALVADDSVDDDEQAFGWLSMAGLGAGIYFGFRWTTAPASSGAVDDAPAAMVRRSSTGAWRMGGPALAPIRTDAHARGLAVTVLGGRW